MDNTDDHEKYRALLRQADGHYRLLPAFDRVPSAHGLGCQAMAVGDPASESTRANALPQARRFGLTPDAARVITREIAEKVAGWTGCTASGTRCRPAGERVPGTNPVGEVFSRFKRKT